MPPRTPPRTVVGASAGRDSVTVKATTYGPDGSIVAVPVADLKRPELIAAATLAYPGIRGDAWMRQTNPAIVDALVNANLPAGITEWAPPDPKHARQRTTKAARRAVRVGEVPAPVSPVDNPVSEATGANGSTPEASAHGAEELLALIRQVAGVQAPNRRGAEAAEALALAARTLEDSARSLRTAAAILRGDTDTNRRKLI